MLCRQLVTLAEVCSSCSQLSPYSTSLLNSFFSTLAYFNYKHLFFQHSLPFLQLTCLIHRLDWIGLKNNSRPIGPCPLLLHLLHYLKIQHFFAISRRKHNFSLKSNQIKSIFTNTNTIATTHKVDFLTLL